MINSEEYKKFLSHIRKEKLTLIEIKKLTESDFVESVTSDDLIDERTKLPRYTVKLMDGTIYYVFEKPENKGSFWDIFKFGK